MSRKDRRAVLLVPLAEREWRWLRDRARGRSLADVVRRLAQDSLDLTYDPSFEDPAVRVLPVQLPKPLRIRLTAQPKGRPAALILRAVVLQAMAQE